MSKPRRWQAWVILQEDETFYRVSLEDPRTVDTLTHLVGLGYIVVPVEIVGKVPV